MIDQKMCIKAYNLRKNMLTYREIAQRLGVSPSAAHRYVQRGGAPEGLPRFISDCNGFTISAIKQSPRRDPAPVAPGRTIRPYTCGHPFPRPPHYHCSRRPGHRGRHMADSPEGHLGWD